MNKSLAVGVLTKAAWMVLIWANAGCVTTQDVRARQETSEREDVRMANERIRRLEGDIESLQMIIEDLRKASEQTQANAAYSSMAESSALRNAVDTLDQRVSRLEAGREEDRKAIIDKVAELVAAPSAAPAAPNRAAVSEFGYEHTVQPGENLSRIAQAYGVSMKSIIEANQLEDPNALRAGQTLFIPE